MYVALDTHLRRAARPITELRRIDAALARDLVHRRQLRQAIHRRTHHVVRVRRAEALREDIGDADTLHHRANRATSDHAGARSRGLHPDFAGAVLAGDFVRDRGARERHLDEVAPSCLDGLADRLPDFVRLTRREAHLSLPVAHGDERVEAEPASALHDLGHAVDRDHVLDQVAPFALPAATVVAATTTAAASAAVGPATGPP